MKVVKQKFVVAALLLFLWGGLAIAQTVENEMQYRTALDLSFKPIKKLNVSFSPEFRWDETLSLDRYLFETGVDYKVLDWLKVGATYRFVVKPLDTKDTEYFNRYAFTTTFKKDYGRFTPALRLRYSNYADDDVVDKMFLRYKVSVKYDIADCKITPFVGAEIFHQLNDREIFKTRYSAGVDYKLFKNNYVGLSYKLDYYKTEYRNRHIVSLGYKIKF